MAVENQVAILFALTQGFLDDVPVEKIAEWEEDFHKYMRDMKADVLAMISEEKETERRTWKKRSRKRLKNTKKFMAMLNIQCWGSC